GDKCWRHAAADDLLLRPGGRRRALAAGARRHSAARRCRGAAAACGRGSAVHEETMTTHTVGIIMNGVTGRMGLNQHLRRSIHAIMQQGGLKIGDRETIMPRPLLVGRNASELESIAAEFGGLPWSTDVD